MARFLPGSEDCAVALNFSYLTQILTDDLIEADLREALCDYRDSLVFWESTGIFAGKIFRKALTSFYNEACEKENISWAFIKRAMVYASFSDGNLMFSIKGWPRYYSYFAFVMAIFFIISASCFCAAIAYVKIVTWLNLIPLSCGILLAFSFAVFMLLEFFAVRNAFKLSQLVVNSNKQLVANSNKQ